MSLLQKKTTLVHHITYMGLMAAINLLFIILATYTQYLMFLLILILPFASAIVSYYCLKRYYIIYAVATLGLCLIFNNFADTIFYIVPALASGFVIGLLIEKKMHPFWMILSTTIINAALTYAFIPLINVIIHDDIVKLTLKLFNLDDFHYRTELVYVSVFIMSLIQCSLTIFILLSDAKKIGMEINTRITSLAPYIIGLEVAVIGALSFALFFLPLAFIFLAISACFAAFLVVDLMAKKKLYVYLMMALAIVLSMLLFAILYTRIIKPYSFLLFAIFPLSIGIVSFVNNYLIIKER